MSIATRVVVVLASLSACYIAPDGPPPQQPRDPPPPPPPTHPVPWSPPQWTVTKSGDACTAREQMMQCPETPPCDLPAQPFACPAGPWDGTLTVLVDHSNGKCYFAPLPCPPGSITASGAMNSCPVEPPTERFRCPPRGAH